MYIVIEIQRSGEDTLAYLVSTHTNINDAYSKFYLVLSAAAISTIPIHGATMLTETGEIVANEYFRHEVA